MLRNCSFFISFSLILLPKISTGKPKGRRPNAVLFLDCQMVLVISQRKVHSYEQWCPPSKVVLSDTASLHMTLRAFEVIIVAWDRHHGPLTIKCKGKSKNLLFSEECLSFSPSFLSFLFLLFVSLFNCLAFWSLETFLQVWFDYTHFRGWAMQTPDRRWFSRPPSDLCWCLHLLCLCLIPNTKREALDCVQARVCVCGGGWIAKSRKPEQKAQVKAVHTFSGGACQRLSLQWWKSCGNLCSGTAEVAHVHVLCLWLRRAITVCYCHLFPTSLVREA